MIAFGAADKNRGQLPAPAVTGYFDSTVESEKFGHVRCLTAFDLFATDDNDRCEYLITRDRYAGCGHHDR